MRLALTLRDQFPDFRDEIVRNAHDRFGGLNTSLIFYHGVVFGLVLVMCEYASHFLFVPSDWKLVLPHCCFFLLRLRNAARSFPAQVISRDDKRAVRF